MSCLRDVTHLRVCTYTCGTVWQCVLGSAVDRRSGLARALAYTSVRACGPRARAGGKTLVLSIDMRDVDIIATPKQSTT